MAGLALLPWGSGSLHEKSSVGAAVYGLFWMSRSPNSFPKPRWTGPWPGGWLPGAECWKRENWEPWPDGRGATHRQEARTAVGLPSSERCLPDTQDIQPHRGGHRLAHCGFMKADNSARLKSVTKWENITCQKFYRVYMKKMQLDRRSPDLKAILNFYMAKLSVETESFLNYQ